MTGDSSYGGVPEVVSLTDNERSWIEFVRLLSKGLDPAPSLAAVQALRRALAARSTGAENAGMSVGDS